MKKRILSSLLAILMLVSLLPMQVFAAEGEVTRIQWLQKLTETFDMTVEADNYPDNYYSDVSSDDSYYRDVMVATEFGLIDQEPGTELKPNEPATREFAAHTLNFCLGYELEEGATYTFADSASLTYANDAQIAVNRNWFALVDGKFMPEQAVTNSEMTAMLADAAAVLEGQEVDTGAQSEYTFADGVKEIPESASVTTSEDGSSLTIVGYTGTLKAGDIVAVHEVFPVIYSVTAVTSADGVLTLTVTKLDADDYIISMNTQGSVDADLSEVEAAEDTDITYIMSNGVETQSAARAQALLRDKKVKIKDVKLDKTLYNSGGIKVKVYGKLTSMNLTYNVKLGGNAPYAMVRVDGKASVGCSASFDSMESLELPSSITLAYVPVAGIGKIAVSAKVSLDGEVTLEYSTNFTAGFEYSKSSGFRAIKNFSTGSFSVQAQVDLKAGIEANAGLADIPFITGYVYIEAGARMKMYYSTVNSNTVKYCVDTSAYLYAKVGYYIGIKNVKTWSDSYEIWDMSNSPMKVHNHFENGVSTGGVCTVGSDCSNKGYGRNGYTTGANSRYYNYGGSNGSSKGTSSSGKPYTIYEYSLDDYKNAVITKYNGNVSALFVPKTIDGYTVVGIGSSAFEGNTNLRFLHFPDTLTSIGQYAFQNCINLGTIDFPESLIEINGYAFYGCNSLTSIKLPSNLQTLSYEAFGYCANLQSVWIPKTITNETSYYGSSSNYGPFDSCAKLKSVTFADGITDIPSGLFESCTGIESIEIPDTVTSIYTHAFQNSSIQSVKIGSGLTTICSYAFSGCKNLTEINLPETLTVIGYQAFNNCINLGTIEFPESLIEINGYAFYGCNSLTSIKLPSNLQTLSYEAFGYCANLQSVWIPKTITNETSYYGSSSNYGPFDSCAKLKSVTFADGITNIPSGLFESCTGIESIEIPDTVTSINTYAFQNSSIRSVKVGSGLTTICSNAFYGCKSLTEINLPETLTSIGYEAFRDCINLGTIDFPESLIEIGRYAFYGCSSLTGIKLPSKITRIENNTFYGCSSMTTAELPEALKSIGEYAFYGCEALEGIVIPDKTYLIENDAFENCSALKSLKCGTGLRTVEYNAFRNCDALTEVTLQEGVTTIGNNAFYDCDGLETIALPNSVTSIGTSLFSGCEKLKNVTLGIGITQIPASMFYQCPKLESIALPYRVTSIGDSAFANSTSFTSITIPRSVTTFGSNIFSYPAKLTIYGVSGTKAETYAGEIGATFVPIDKPATSATLDKTTLNINKGSSAKLNLSVQPIDFTDEVNWKSANTSVVTVAADGTVKAVGVGTTTIKVTVGNASASCKVTVVQPVTSIYLNTTSLSMEALSTYQLTATAYPNDAYDKSVKWESSDTSVATVSEDGLVTAVGKGTATIKATSTAVSSVSRSCTVTVTNNGIVAKDVAQLESPHNYSNNCSDIWLYTLPDASKITVTFDERTNIEDGFDYLYIYNASGEQVGKYTGTELAGKSIDIDGDTVKIKLVSDGGGNEWGFKVTDVKVASGAHVHSYTSVVTAPSCTEKGYTTHTCTCGDSYVDSYTDALGHSYGAWKQTKAPTCTAAGIETRTCTRCNASETRDINALGHDIKHHAAKAATCTEKGWAAYDTCSRCNYSTYKEIAATGHKHNAVVTAPTCTAQGYTTHTCSSCGNSYKDSYTNALGHNYTNGKCTRCGAADPNYNPTPAAPALKITTSAGKPKISWNAVDGAAKYWVYRSTDGKTFKYYDSTTKTSYTNKSTSIGTTYYYKVKAVNVVDGKNYASAYSVSKGIQCKPAAPTVSINRSNGKPKLSWKAVSGATKYWIYRSTDGVNFKYWDSTTKTSYTNSGAESGKKYYYHVKAVAVVNGKNITSANSSTKSLFTSLAKPSVSITTSNGKPKLTWKAVTGADKYYIYRSTDGKNFSYWDSTTKTTYVNSGAKKNTKYYYKVKAVCASNSNANSAQSSTVSIKAAK